MFVGKYESEYEWERQVIIIQTQKGFRIVDKQSVGVGEDKTYVTFWEAWRTCLDNNWEPIYTFRWKPFPVILNKFGEWWELLDGDTPIEVFDTFEEVMNCCEKKYFKIIGVNT